jgi:hypothetical protein
MKALQFSFWFCVGLFSELGKALSKLLLIGLVLLVFLTPIFWKLVIIVLFTLGLVGYLGSLQPEPQDLSDSES